jgi:hypothetical protein
MVGALSACSSVTSSASPAQTSATQNAAASSSLSTTAAPVATSADSASAASAPVQCSASDMTVTGQPAIGGLGHQGLTLSFTNHAAAPCTLTGYPGAAALNAAGDQTVQAQRTLNGYLGGCKCSTPPTVVIAPGASATSLIEGDIAGGNGCVAATALLVTPPNMTRATRLTSTLAVCQLQIHPVVVANLSS